MQTVNKGIERLARIGYIAKGMLYATIGILAAAAAMGNGGKSTDSRGAMGAVMDAPFGRFLLFAMALGLVGYAIWRIVEGVTDPENRGNDAKGLAVRASMVIRGLVHASLALSAIKLATYHASSGGGNASADHWTSVAFGLPGGKVLVWLVALSFMAFGAYQVFRAITAKLGERMNIGQASAEAGRWIIPVSRFGIGARGLVFIAIGVLFARAAKAHDAAKAGGIAEALRSIEGTNHWAFAAIAIGLIAYGGYQFLNARYRRISPRV